MKEILPCEQEK